MARPATPRWSATEAANLARLGARGYPIPDGFCLTVHAWKDDAWRDEVRAAALALPGPWVARSSSTAEDAVGMAFAGIFQTVLDIPNVDALLTAVETVRTSTNAEAMAAYAERQHFDASAVDMSVLIQPIVRASSAWRGVWPAPGLRGARDLRRG